MAKALQHPLDKGTEVRVEGRQFIFTVNRPIERGDKLIGYWLTGPKLKQRAIPLEAIKPKRR